MKRLVAFAALPALLALFLGADCDFTLHGPLEVHVEGIDAGLLEPPDAAPANCPVPNGRRIVATGDSLATGFAAKLSAHYGWPVESTAFGGAIAPEMPDVSGDPAILVVGIGTNDLRYVQYVGVDGGSGVPEWARVATIPDFVASIENEVAKWATRQRIAGHTVLPSLTVPINHYSGNPERYEEARLALNVLRVEAGAKSLVTDIWFGDNADTTNRTCFLADEVHMEDFCIQHRVDDYAVWALEQCP